jgi:hypothetical protein
MIRLHDPPIFRDLEVRNETVIYYMPKNLGVIRRSMKDKMNVSTMLELPRPTIITEPSIYGHIKTHIPTTEPRQTAFN